jgi:two-component system, sensor histidine kinase
MIAIPPALARSVLDDAPDAMVIIDTFGTIWFANRRVSALFGYAHGEIIGQSIEKLMPERFRFKHIGQRGQFADDVRVRPMGSGPDLCGLHCDGTEFPLEVSLSPVEDAGRTLVAAAIRDVTDRRRVEEELVVARDAVEAMRELADRANQGRKRFLKAASHDLRQPLQTLALLNVALRRYLTNPGVADILSQQEQAIGAMSRLLNDLFQIGKLDSGAIQPEPSDFAVPALFEELRAEFAGTAAGKGLALDIEPCDGLVHGDRSLVALILRELISNAIQHTHEGWVRLHCLRKDSFVRIEVLDTGVGIPPEQLPYIFDEFHQGDGAADSSLDGYGLGLSIVKRLTNLLRVELDVRSEAGRGSAFALVLPDITKPADMPPPQPSVSPATSNARGP